MTVLDVAGRLPGIAELREHCRALAIISPDWESRYSSFNSAWAPRQRMASMRDGPGNDWSIVFCAEGAYVRGFDHESPMSPYASDNDGPWRVSSAPYRRPSASSWRNRRSATRTGCRW